MCRLPFGRAVSTRRGGALGDVLHCDICRALLKGIARGDIDDPAVVRRIALSVGVEVRPSGLLSMLQNIAAAITDHDPHMMLEQDDPPLRAAAVAAGEEGQRKMRGDPAPRVETPGEIRDDLAGRHTAVEEIAARLAEERINWPPLPRTGVPQPRTQKPAARVAAGRYRTESVVHATRLEAFLPVWDSSEPSAQEKRASSPGVQCDTAEASEDSNGGRVRSRRESRVERHNVEREHNEAGEERARGGGWQPWQQWNGGGVRRPREERDIEKRVAVMGFDDDFIGEETLERHGSNTEKDVHHGKTTMGRKGRRRPSLSTTGETRRTREEQEERCRVEDGKPGEVLGGSREERKGEPKDERETPQEKRKETCLEGGGTSKREEDVKKKRRRGLPGEVYWGQAEGRGVRKRKRRVLPGEEEEGTETMGKRMGETAKSRNEGWEKPGSKSREARKAREGENGMERAESDGEHAVSIGQAREERAPSDEAAATVWAKRVQKKTCAAHHSPSTRPGPGESAGHLAPSGGRVDDGSRHNTPVLPWESETGEDGMGSLSTHALGDMFSDRWLWAGV